MMEAMLSFLRRQVGLRTDSADAAGSLHAKIKDIRDNGINTINTNILTRQAPRSGYVGSFSTTITTYVTALSISGKGRLYRLQIKSADSTNNTYVRVTIDGREVAYYYTSLASSWIEISTYGYDSIPFNLCFKTSLVIELHTEYINYAAYVRWVYEIE